uniref:Uncharacterized protein n=1 Tax=Anguilla anguilla TaxID=7936 RepID=A0A0E9U4S8_ANGAN
MNCNRFKNQINTLCCLSEVTQYSYSAA